MSETSVLSSLTLDYWYKVIMVVSFCTFILCGTGVLSAFPVAPTACISAGLFFIGLGEWINHPIQTTLMSGNAYYPAGTITGHPRNNKLIGILFVILGLILTCMGVYYLFR